MGRLICCAFECEVELDYITCQQIVAYHSSKMFVKEFIIGVS